MEAKRQEHRTKSRQWNKRGMLRLAYIFLFAYLLFYFGNLHYRNWIQMEQKVRDAKTTYSNKLDRLEELKKEKRKLKDPEYVAKIAREELYFMKPGEVRIEVSPDPAENEE